MATAREDSAPNRLEPRLEHQGVRIEMRYARPWPRARYKLTACPESGEGKMICPRLPRCEQRRFRKRQARCLAEVESLNSDPHNVRAEELALEECMRGIDVRRTWSEKSQVVNFGGSMSPGTPDGIFEDWDSNLTCVQVVRVPITPAMDTHEVGEVLYHTVLTKIIKSQAWLIASKTRPRYFIIFCWLPRLQGDYSEVGGARTQALLERLRMEGWPFYVRAMVPDRHDDLFPAKFAFNQTLQEGHDCNSRQGNQAIKGKKNQKCVSEADLSTVDPTSYSHDSDEEISWNIFDEEVEAQTMDPADGR